MSNDVETESTRKLVAFLLCALKTKKKESKERQAILTKASWPAFIWVLVHSWREDSRAQENTDNSEKVSKLFLKEASHYPRNKQKHIKATVENVAIHTILRYLATFRPVVVYPPHTLIRPNAFECSAGRKWDF